MKILKNLGIGSLIIGLIGVFALSVSAVPLFEAAVKYGCGGNPQSIKTAHLNGDTNLDLVTANLAGNNVSVLLGVGDGTFAAAVNYIAGAGVYSVDIADMNNDGSLDLVVGTENDVSVLYGVGDGTFGAATPIAGTMGTISAVVANLDGDVHLDIGTASYFQDSSSVVLSHDTSTWVAPVFYPIGNAPVSITAGNLDADANVDLVVATDMNGIWMLTNNGAGSFTSTQIMPDNWEWPMEIIAEDLNGDNETDLAIAHYDNADFTVLLSNGDGTFETPVSYFAALCVTAIASADMDGDLVKDMLAGIDFDNNIEFYKGAGDGTFTLDSTFSVGTSPSSIVTGDFAVASGDGNNVSVFINRLSLILDVDENGVELLPGKFELSQNYPNPFNPTTSISYTLPRKSNVELSIFNITGQAVRTLVNNNEAAGDYKVTWDGCDDDGNTLSSGVYLYRLKTDEGSQSRKMSLLK